jgi:hypothetical protein
VFSVQNLAISQICFPENLPTLGHFRPPPQYNERTSIFCFRHQVPSGDTLPEADGDFKRKFIEMQ